MTGKEKLIRKMLSMTTEELAEKMSDSCPTQWFKTTCKLRCKAEDCKKCWEKFLVQEYKRLT